MLPNKLKIDLPPLLEYGKDWGVGVGDACVGRWGMPAFCAMRFALRGGEVWGSLGVRRWGLS
jgi:hypothetical protein